MAGSSKRTRAQENKRIRQEALRDQLAAGGHIQHVIDIAEKMADVDIEMPAQDVSRLKAAADIKLKLINKYLPDLKVVEVSGSDDEDSPPLKIEFNIKRAKGEVKTTNAKS